MRLTDRLSHCFDTADHDQIRAYLSIVRNSWGDISTAITRNSWIIALLIAAFELAAHRALSTLTLGPLVLGNIKYVRLFIPPVVSYLFYEQILLATRWMETEAVHRYLTHILSPQVETYDFDYFLTPRLPALSNLVHSYSQASTAPSKKVRAAGQYGLSVLILVSIPAFDAFALYQLSTEFGITSLLFWLVLTVTSSLVILTLAVFTLWLSEERLVV